MNGNPNDPDNHPGSVCDWCGEFKKHSPDDCPNKLAYPNVRDCEHGQLRRACELCQCLADIAAQAGAAIEMLRERITELEKDLRISENVKGQHTNGGKTQLMKLAREQSKRAEKAEARVEELEGALCICSEYDRPGHVLQCDEPGCRGCTHLCDIHGETKEPNE
jgi:hypothetical protein